MCAMDPRPANRRKMKRKRTDYWLSEASFWQREIDKIDAEIGRRTEENDRLFRDMGTAELDLAFSGVIGLLFSSLPWLGGPVMGSVGTGIGGSGAAYTGYNAKRLIDQMRKTMNDNTVRLSELKMMRLLSIAFT